MGEILGLGMSHFPGMRNAPGNPSGIYRTLQRPDVPELWKNPENWPEELREELGQDEGRTAGIQHRKRFGEECRKVRQALDDFKPDFVLIWGDDQYENFREDVVPAFCVLAYDDMDVYPHQPVPGRQLPPNAWGEAADTKFHIRGKRDSAKYLVQGLINQKIDVAYAYEPLHYNGFSHAFLNIVLYMDWDRNNPWNYPTVPFPINCYGSRVIVNRGGAYPVGKIEMAEGELDPPGPTPERCMEVGAATVRVLAASPWRVAVMASSSWSHASLTPKHFFLYPDMQADHAMYDALVRGDFAHWRGVQNDDVDSSGHQELRNWWTLMGAMEELGHRGPTYHSFIESYTQNSNKCFAIYQP